MQEYLIVADNVEEARNFLQGSNVQLIGKCSLGSALVYSWINETAEDKERLVVLEQQRFHVKSFPL